MKFFFLVLLYLKNVNGICTGCFQNIRDVEDPYLFQKINKIFHIKKIIRGQSQVVSGIRYVVDVKTHSNAFYNLDIVCQDWLNKCNLKNKIKYNHYNGTKFVYN